MKPNILKKKQRQMKIEKFLIVRIHDEIKPILDCACAPKIVPAPKTT